MSGERILVIEDERDIAELITYNLKREGFRTVAAGSGEKGLDLAGTESPDLVLLDIMLPGISGLDVCRALKRDPRTVNIPVILLTARNEDIDVVTGLEVGADDYVTKPFSPKVLAARIRAVLRRKASTAIDNDSPVVQLGDVVIERDKRQVTIGSEQLDLTFTEYELLLLLARRPGWVYSRSHIIDTLREGQHVITDRAIDVQVANLRRKLGQCGNYVETVRGVGYRMKGTP